MPATPNSLGIQLSSKGSTMSGKFRPGALIGINDPNGSSSGSSGQPVRPDARDAELLDAYSQAVVNVVEKTSPAVVSVTGRGDERQGGSGSAFIITPDGYAVT